ncbi:MAG: alkaline phosphatase family protein [Candidatus Eisenbacteria bacterium]
MGFIKTILKFGAAPAAFLGLLVGFELAGVNYVWEVPRDLFFLLFWSVLLFALVGFILGTIGAVLGALRSLGTGGLAFLIVTISAGVFIFADRFAACYHCHQFLDHRAPHLIYHPFKSFMLAAAVALASAAAGALAGLIALVIVRRWSSRKVRIGFFGAVAAVAIVSCVWSYLSVPTRGVAAYADPKTGAPERIGGIDKVLLIIDDGVTWDIIDPLMREGRLPAYRRLTKEGTRADLATLSPTVSPPVWTTLATGHSPERHAVGGFINYAFPGMKNGIAKFPCPTRMMLPDIFIKLHARGFGSSRPLGPSHRRVRAVWNIAGDAGADVGIVGWRYTWPVEGVRGFMVSDRLHADEPRDHVHPPELASYISDITGGLPEPSLSRFIGCPAESLEAYPKASDRINMLKWHLKSDLRYQAVAESLFGTMHASLMAMGLTSIDAIEHLFYYEHSLKRHPEEYPMTDYLSRFTSEPLVKWLGDTIENTYVFHDSLMGFWMDWLGDDYALIIASDHGHAMDGDAHHYPESGILILWGRPFRQGVTLTEASVYDIAPTVLYLLGLPIGEDMPGRVLTEAFRDTWLARHSIATIETYEIGRLHAGKAPPEVDDQLLDRLKALGYIN